MKLNYFFIYSGDDDDELGGAGGKDWGDLGEINFSN
jgi:hypothetical protein